MVDLLRRCHSQLHTLVSLLRRLRLCKVAAEGWPGARGGGAPDEVAHAAGEAARGAGVGGGALVDPRAAQAAGDGGGEEDVSARGGAPPAHDVRRAEAEAGEVGAEWVRAHAAEVEVRGAAAAAAEVRGAGRGRVGVEEAVGDVVEAGVAGGDAGGEAPPDAAGEGEEGLVLGLDRRNHLWHGRRTTEVTVGWADSDMERLQNRGWSGVNRGNLHHADEKADVVVSKRQRAVLAEVDVDVVRELPRRAEAPLGVAHLCDRKVEGSDKQGPERDPLGLTPHHDRRKLLRRVLPQYVVVADGAGGASCPSPRSDFIRNHRCPG